MEWRSTAGAVAGFEQGRAPMAEAPAFSYLRD